MKKPNQLTESDLKDIKEKCQAYLDFMDDDDDYCEDLLEDYKNDVFEAAMEAIFGEDVWEYINNRQE